MAVEFAAGRHPRRPLPRQRVLPRQQAFRTDRFLFRLHGRARLRRRYLPQRLVLRERPLLQRDQGQEPAAGLWAGAPPLAGGAPRTTVARARRGAALSADAAGRLVRRAAWRAGPAEGSIRVLPQAALPSGGQERARLRNRGMIEPHVVVHTDGACSGNPGPGGWGAILAFGDHEKELKGGEAHTTNNRMELMAAIAALEALKRPCLVDIHTDSQYLRNGILTWINQWKGNGWRTADRKPVRNVDLWQRLDALLTRHRVRWHWVRGHAGHLLNERADRLAREGLEDARLPAGKRRPS